MRPTPRLDARALIHKSQRPHPRVMRPFADENASPAVMDDKPRSSSKRATPAVVRWTTTALPRDAELKRELHIPLGIVVNPLDRRAVCRRIARLKSPERIARCSSCYGYVSAHCRVNANGFRCCACGTYTLWRDAAKGSRYSKGLAAIQALPEISGETYEFDVAVETISDGKSEVETEEASETLEANDWRRRAVRNDASTAGTSRRNARAIVAIVDLNGAGEEYCELVKLALGSAMEALDGEDARFGVFTFRGDTLEAIDFSDVGAKDVQDMDGVRLKYFDSHANPRKHGFIRRVQDVVSSIGDVLTSLLTPTPGWKDVISDAIDDRIVGDMSTTDGRSEGRIFGPVLDEVLSFIEQAVDDGFISSARVLAFLRGGPSRGVGSCDVGRLSKSVADVLLHENARPTMEDFEFASREADSLMIPAHDHYESVGERCLIRGVEVDVVVTSDDFNDLTTLAPLAERSGGTFLLYPNAQNIPIVGDIYRLLRNEKAINATLRIRSTADLEIANAYGSLHADKAYPGLYHIASCATKDTFAFDFDYATSAGLEEDLNGGYPKIQLAFEYTCITRDVDRAAGEVVVHRRRRRRIHTCRANIARSARDVYKHVDANAMMCVLARQALMTADEEGSTEARRALVDWFIAFSSAARKTSNTFEFVTDVVPRLVYGLLRSKILHPMGSHPDARVAARSRLLRFDADDSATYAYPELRAFEECNEGEENAIDGTNGSSSLFSKGRMPLRRQEVEAANGVLLIRGDDEVVVAYIGPEAVASCPPAHGSALDREIRRIREQSFEGTFLPRVTHVRLGGADDPSPVDARLVEELESEFAPGAYDGFVDFCARAGEEIDRAARR